MLWNILNTLIAGVAVFFSIKNAFEIKKQTRPSVLFMDQLGPWETPFGITNRFELHFINTGSREAVNVDIPKKYIQKYDFLSEWKAIRRELAANGGQTKCARGSETGYTARIEDLVINYEDTTGKKYRTTYKNGNFIFS